MIIDEYANRNDDCRNGDQFAYFTVQMWNAGVYYHRLNNLSEAERFLSMAIQLSSFCQDQIQVDQIAFKAYL